MECSICMCEKELFKYLSCNHYYCSQCVERLACAEQLKNYGVSDSLADLKLQTSAAATANSEIHPEIVPASNPASSVGGPSLPGPLPPIGVPMETNASAQQKKSMVQVQCPTCRHVTQLDDVTNADGSSNPASMLQKLKTKLFRKLVCYQCDQEKFVGEFRWCHQCLLSVCSRCYVDKHIMALENGAVIPHASSWWDDLNGVRFCVGQLKHLSTNIDKKCESTKKYVESYLDGLKEYLFAEIERNAHAAQKQASREATQICEAFGLPPPSECQPGQGPAAANNPINNGVNNVFQYALKDIRKLLEMSSVVNPVDVRFSIQNVPYRELAGVILASEKKSIADIAWFEPRLLQEKLLDSTQVIGLDALKAPNDFCVVDEDKIVIADNTRGLFLYSERHALFGHIRLHHSYQHYTRVNQIPQFDNRSMLMVNVNWGAWGFLLVFWDVTKQEYRHYKHSNGNFHFSFPSNNNLAIGTSGQSLFALSPKTLYKFDSLTTMSWREVYGLAQENPQQYFELGPIKEGPNDVTNILLVNSAWQSIDILSLDSQHNIAGLKRVEFALLLKCPGTNLAEPCLANFCNEQLDLLLLWDKRDSRLHLWDFKTSDCKQILDFGEKCPQQIWLNKNCFYAIVQQKNHQNLKCLQKIALKHV